MKITKIGIFAVLFMATITLFAGPSDKMKEALEKGDKSFFAKVKWKSFEAANNTDPKTTFIASSCYQKEEKCAEALIGVLSNSDGQVRASVFGELQYNVLEGLRKNPAALKKLKKVLEKHKETDEGPGGALDSLKQAIDKPST